MIERITGGKVLPAEVVQQIVAKTDGVPLFVEELTKSILESGLLQEVEDHYELTDPCHRWRFPPHFTIADGASRSAGDSKGCGTAGRGHPGADISLRAP